MRDTDEIRSPFTTKQIFGLVIIIGMFIVILYGMSIKKETMTQGQETERETNKKSDRGFNFTFGKKKEK